MRFYMYQLLQQYDRVLYVDSDMLFLQSCENVFNLVPYNSIGYVKMMPLQPFKSRIRAYNQLYGTDYKSIEVSGGFHMFSKIHREYLNLEILNLNELRAKGHSFLIDLSYMQYLISKLTVENGDMVLELPKEYNYLYAHILYNNTDFVIKNRQYANEGNVKIIHFPGLSPLYLQQYRFNLMKYFNKKFGIKQRIQI